MRRHPFGLAARVGRLLLGALPLVLLVCWLASTPASVAAHAYLDTSDPPANAQLTEAPTEVYMTFTEPLERSGSRFELYDQSGQPVPDTLTRVPEPGVFDVTIPLPDDLPDGTYAVFWRTLSAADGHTSQGYFAFTIGDTVEAVVAPVVPIDTETPLWARAIGRWLALVGLSLAVAVWPLWVLVLRPAWVAATGRAIDDDQVQRARRFAVVAMVTAVFGSLIALVIQARDLEGSGLGNHLWTTLTDTRYGSLWLMRLALVGVLAGLLWRVDWMHPLRTRWLSASAVLVSLVLPLPFSLISHAAALGVGRGTAVMADLLHTLGAAVWIGGLFLLLTWLIPAARRINRDERAIMLSVAIPRFSAIALTAWVILAVTGLYAAWLHVGSLAALRETAYGGSLIAKVALLVPLLILAAVNLLIISPRLGVGTPRRRRSARVRLGRIIAVEIALVLVVLLVVGRLTSQEPARDAYAADQEMSGVVAGLIIPVAFADRADPATLLISPGTPGVNTYTLEMPGELLATNVSAELRIELSALDTGQRTIRLNPDASDASRFTGSGSELAIQGEWTVQVLVQQPGTRDLTEVVTAPVAETATHASVGHGVVDDTWRFGTLGVIAAFLMASGVGVLAVMVTRVSRQPWTRLLGAAAGTMVFATLLFGAAYVDDWPSAAVDGETVVKPATDAPHDHDEAHTDDVDASADHP